MPRKPTLQSLWEEVGFKPNPSQKDAILHIDGPLFLTAGPGSGKTRVLLWRTLNLIVYHDVKPDEIFLSTFTEKAATQLRDGLRSLLGLVTNKTGTPYDISRMYVGTVHALCQQLMLDRRFTRDRHRGSMPVLLDQIDQYFFVRNPKYWEAMKTAAGIVSDAEINDFFGTLYTNTDTGNREPSPSKHSAITDTISLFNRFSEEALNAEKAFSRADNDSLKKLIRMYEQYQHLLANGDVTARTDFSLVQKHAYDALAALPDSGNIFRHIIIDEYQDTNTIQERLFFKLGEGHRNICVVGDDDQALYRFRGATVENFVQFPRRCRHYLGMKPTEIPLAINYRSQQRIVHFYTGFIERCNWKRDDGKGHYRVHTKKIRPHSDDRSPAVVASTHATWHEVCTEIAALVKKLIDEKKVEDPNQIAFLYPSLKYNGVVNKPVERMIEALESQGLRVYAPRAGRFLEVDESIAFFGVLLHILGKPERGTFRSRGFDTFFGWIEQCMSVAKDLMKKDKHLARFVEERRTELETRKKDLAIMKEVAEKKGWALSDVYTIDTMKRPLYNAPGLSEMAKKMLSSTYFERIIKDRIAEKDPELRLKQPPFALSYILNTATSADWNLLDLFYRLSGYEHFKEMFDLAERGEDEGPICNLAQLTQYLARFMDTFSPVISASYLEDQKFHRTFFLTYIYTLFRMGESESENEETPFPKGRIPFLTIHQAKGLEFPVVVLGNPNRGNREPQQTETIMHELLDRDSEPLDRSPVFDHMRKFYVALSRPKNLLIIAHPRGQGVKNHENFQEMLDSDFPRIPNLDIGQIPVARHEEEETSKTYSYTSDYLLYQRCPRQYMIFRKYGFVASRSETQFFGSLVHQTIEELHQFLINERSNKKGKGKR